MSDFATRFENAADPTSVAAGNYIARITRATVSDKNFDPQDKRKFVDWEFTIENGPYNQRKIWIKNYLDPKPGGKDPIGILKGNCKALELSPKSVEDLALQLEGVTGKRIELKVSQREWDGKTRNDARIIGYASGAELGVTTNENDVPF